MQRLVHKELQRLGELLRTVVEAFRLYGEQKPELHASLLELLDRAATAYREAGRPERQSHVESLRAELATALRGIDPSTLERPATRRREMQSSIAFKVLQALESSLRGSFQQATETLERGESLVSQIVIAGIQKGLIDEATIRDATTQEALESLWRSLAADADIALGQKRTLLLVSPVDVHLLLDDVLARLRA